MFQRSIKFSLKSAIFLTLAVDIVLIVGIFIKGGASATWDFVVFFHTQMVQGLPPFFWVILTLLVLLLAVLFLIPGGTFIDWFLSDREQAREDLEIDKLRKASKYSSDSERFK